MRLEDEACVVIEIAREARLEAQRRDVDAERGDKADPRVERVERRGEIETRLRREPAQLRRSRVRIALDAQEALDDRDLLGRHAGAVSERRLLQKAVGDLARRASADRGDARDRKKILDEGARALLVGALQHAEHAGMIAPGAIARGVEDRRDGLALAVAARDAAAPFRRKIERGEQRRKQPGVADAHAEIVSVGDGRRIERERQDFGVRRLEVRAGRNSRRRPA